MIKPYFIVCFLAACLLIACTAEPRLADEKELSLSVKDSKGLQTAVLDNSKEHPYLFLEHGSSLDVKVSGNGDYKIDIFDPSIASAVVKKNSIVFSALQEGMTEATITDGEGLTMSLEISVGKIGTRQSDSLALLDVYRTTNPGEWVEKWLINYPMKYWKGVKLNSDGRVISLDLNANNLRGPFPSSISKLFFLEHLDLSNNRLNTEVNPDLYKLVNLRYLSLAFMSWEAISPETISNLSRLSKLDTLELIQLRLTNDLGPVFDKFKNLKSLSIRFDRVTTFPTEICDMTNLENLELFGLKSGRIPDQIGNLKNLRRLVIGRDNDVENSGVEGWIPASIGKMSHLEVLNLQYNNLTGPLPQDILQLHNLKAIYLSKNKLTSIPEDWSGLDSLRYVSLKDNQIEGEVPNFGANTKLKYIDLSYNRLTGSIPSSYGGLQGLSKLSLDHNRLDGEIPEELTGLANLRILELQNNNLTGNIPEGFAAFQPKDEFDTFKIDVTFNRLTGKLSDVLKRNPMYYRETKVWFFDPQQDGYGLTNLQ